MDSITNVKINQHHCKMLLTQIHGSAIVNIVHEKGGENKAMVEIRKLKKAISDRGMSITFLAKKLGLTRETMYNRFSSGDFKASEIAAITEALNLNRDERDAIFFADRVN